ncbi:MAG: metal ABC transporter substrate-binding protein, partial [Desulfofundulus sp.]
MPARRLATLLTLLLTFVLFAHSMSGCASQPSQGPKEDAAERKIRVVATIFPIADMARQIGGDKVAVVTLLPPGASPHTFEVTPQQMKDMGGAQVFLKVGAGLDLFADKLAAAAGPNMKKITLVDNMKLVRSLAGAHQDGHGGYSGVNPHVWLDPILVRDEIVPVIAAAFSEVSPENAEYFAANLKKYQRELTDLDSEIRAAAKGWKVRSFVAFHSAWEYFAERYGLRCITVEEFPGKEPSAKWLAEVVNRACAERAGAVMAEPQFSPQAAQM